MADEYLKAILRGELPPELDTVFQRMTPSVFAALHAALAIVFGLVHEDVRERYAPAVRIETHHNDVLRWLAENMREVLPMVEQANPEFSEDEIRAIRSMLQGHGESIRKIFEALEASPGEP